MMANRGMYFDKVILIHTPLSMASLGFIFMVINFDCRDKSLSGHSVTVRDTVVASSLEINGATAFEVAGTITFSFCLSE